MNRLLTLSIFIATLNCAQSVVVGSLVEDIQAHPYQASLSYHHKPACGGTLISQQHILTDARCFFNLLGASLKERKWIARLGSAQSNSGGTTIPIQKIILSSNYSGQPELNMALALLSKQIEESKTIKPITVPNADNTAAGAELILTGYGINEIARPRRNMHKLHSTKLITIAADKCKGLLANVTVANNMFCAETKSYAGACFGDNGSPIVKVTPNEKVLAGYVLYDSKCGRRPTLFMKASDSTVLGFIKNAMESKN